MRSRRVRTRLAAALVLLCACTSSGTPSPNPTVPTTSAPAESPTPPPTTFLENGEPLPANCRQRKPTSTQTIAFSAQDRIWALDPGTGRLSCLLENEDAGPFLWGPQGDRVLLGDFQVAGWDAAPSFAPTGIQPEIVDWGHPIGIAVVFTEADTKRPRKFFLETDETTTLRNLPAATYLDVAYHPTGLALGFILERGGKQSIWLSTNEGEQAKRLVFTSTGTTFSDLSFTHDGGTLIYMAHHAEGYSHLHTIDLSIPDTIDNVWKGPVGRYVRTVIVSPDDQLYALTDGESCAESRAALLVGRAERALLPDVDGPTTALGWLDPLTVLVGAGGCGATMDVYAVPASLASAPSLLVSGVSAAASRAPSPPGTPALPEEVLLDTGSGVG